MPVQTLSPDPEFTVDSAALQTVGESGSSAPPRQRSRGPRAALLALLVLVAGAAAWYFLWPRTLPHPQEVAPAPPATPPAAQKQVEPAIAYPVEKIAPEAASGSSQALPTLDGSDVAARDAIAAIFNGDSFARLLVPNGVIRHVVATVDNLPRQTVATRIRPVVPAAGLFATASTAQGMAIAGDNAARYAAYVKAAESIDTRRLAELYVRLYPLLQQAYVELGYPHDYFNDRLVTVIDHLLAAPEPKPPVYVSQPKVLYEFTDPALEELSAGQKMMVRVGIDNELRLKAKLREIRKAVTAGAPGAASVN
jgi:hypothetical protein